jgi:hypothetical protein
MSIRFQLERLRQELLAVRIRIHSRLNGLSRYGHSSIAVVQPSVRWKHLTAWTTGDLDLEVNSFE